VIAAAITSLPHERRDRARPVECFRTRQHALRVVRMHAESRGFRRSQRCRLVEDARWHAVHPDVVQKPGSSYRGESITCNAELWASCIGGATQIDSYLEAIEEAGLQVKEVRDNTAYEFLSDSAQAATRTYGIKSISLVAVSPG